MVSLCASAVEVMANPADPWAWAGLVGDAIDLIPFVTGVGEITKVAKVTINAADNSVDVVTAARRLFNSSGVSSGIRTFTGSYEIVYESGMTYVGKGGFYRSTRSAKRYVDKYGDVVSSITWTPASNSVAAFIDEFTSMLKYGGPNNNEIGNIMSYNKIWSPGRKMLN